MSQFAGTVFLDQIDRLYSSVGVLTKRDGQVRPTILLGASNTWRTLYLEHFTTELSINYRNLGIFLCKYFLRKICAEILSGPGAAKKHITTKMFYARYIMS